MNTANQSASRVVITGIGVISPIGIGVQPFDESIQVGRSGVSRIDALNYSAVPGHVAGEVKDFTATTARKVYLKAQRKSLKVMCRDIQLGVASAVAALEHAAIDLDSMDRDRVGVEFGANQMHSPPDVLKDGCWACVPPNSTKFDDSQWGANGLHKLEPLWLLKYLPNMPACHIGILADARGPNNSLTQAEASGNLALAEATRIIRRGRADLMLCGTTGSRIHAVKCLHAALHCQLADHDAPPETWSRPFDRSRNGQVIGEAACSMILEEENHAVKRGATILGTVLSSGASCVNDGTGQGDARRALVNAMKTALTKAGLSPKDIGHIHANGLGEVDADIAEAQAIHDVFGDGGATVPVTALKSLVGNAGAGCGIMELAASVLSLRHGVIPKTLNYQTPDPDCPVNVTRENTPTENRIVLNINVTAAGQASAIIVAVA